MKGRKIVRVNGIDSRPPEVDPGGGAGLIWEEICIRRDNEPLSQENAREWK